MEEDARQTVLDMKFASVIDMYSKLYGVSLETAANTFYNSLTMTLIEKGTADLHCRSDKYLAEELWLEVQERQGDSHKAYFAHNKNKQHA